MRPVRRRFRSDELKNLSHAKAVYDRSMRDIEAALSNAAKIFEAASHDVPDAYNRWVETRNALFQFQFMRDIGAEALRIPIAYINEDDGSLYAD